MRCPRCGKALMLFEQPTEYLNGLMRTAVDALRSQTDFDNPLASDELKEAVDSLEQAAVHFTNTLYREEP